MTPPLWLKVKRTKEPLDENERGEWESWFKAQHSETKIMASGPITSWQIDEETMDTATDFIFLAGEQEGGGSKITEMVTAAMKLKDTCSLE